MRMNGLVFLLGLALALVVLPGQSFGTEPPLTGDADNPIWTAEGRPCEVVALSANGERVLAGVLAIDREATGGDGEIRAWVTIDVPREGAQLLRFDSAGVPVDVRNALQMPDFFFFRPRLGTWFGECRLDLRQPGPAMYSSQLPHAVSVVDARGKSAKGFRAVLTTTNGIVLLDRILDAEAVVPPVYVQTESYSVDSRADLEHTTTTLAEHMTLELVVTHSVSGVGQKMYYPVTASRLDGTFAGFSDTLQLALMAPESGSGTEPVFRGIVVDDRGAPLPDAAVAVAGVELPGRGGRQINHGPILLTGFDGRFEFALPVDLVSELTSQPSLPAEASVVLRVGAPPAAKELAGQSATVRVGTEVRVILRHAEVIRARLRDTNGRDVTAHLKPGWSTALKLIWTDPPPEENDWRQVNLQVYFRVQDDGAILLDPVALPATYEIEYEGRKFGAIRLERGTGTGPEVVWIQEDEGTVTFEGRVVNARSGVAVSGAYLALVNEGSAPWLVASMPDKDRNEIWKDVPQDGKGRLAPPAESGLKLSDGRRLFALKALGRTAPDGRFTLSPAKGEQAVTVAVWAPGMIGAEAEPYTITKENVTRSGSFDLGEVPLIPAVEARGKVLAPPYLPDEHLRVGNERPAGRLTFNLGLDFDRVTTSGGWAVQVPKLNPDKTHPWKLVAGPDWGEAGSEFLMFAPADSVFRISAGNWNEPALEGVVWNDIGPAAPGSKLQLESKEFGVKRPYIVRVSHADGPPAPGRSVRINGRLPVVTDANGEVIGWSGGATISRIDVMRGQGWEVDAGLRDVELPENVSETPRIEIQLKAE